IDRAAEQWAQIRRDHSQKAGGSSVAKFFKYAAERWLQFHGRLRLPALTPKPSADLLEDFATDMRREQGLSEYSVESHFWKTSQFPSWLAERNQPISGVTLEDVDSFLAFKGRNGWSRKS